ncbi:hypothetical protein DE146DRAFT_149906 [Phaeosphaeria sp. MPI-PUGE-AT-0046c]|nr:hypothetical protein DE146DRAFT_149906 [Phaeosphaeria sp. MPI-PUGE-AT-0046c]
MNANSRLEQCSLSPCHLFPDRQTPSPPANNGSKVACQTQMRLVVIPKHSAGSRSMPSGAKKAPGTHQSIRLSARSDMSTARSCISLAHLQRIDSQSPSHIVPALHTRQVNQTPVSAHLPRFWRCLTSSLRIGLTKCRRRLRRSLSRPSTCIGSGEKTAANGKTCSVDISRLESGVWICLGVVEIGMFGGRREERLALGGVGRTWREIGCQVNIRGGY